MTSFQYDRLPVSDIAGFDKHVATLTTSQKAFVALLNDWWPNREKENLFVRVTGGPGCGKTHGVVETLRYLDMRTVKMSFTARLALKIGGETVHKTLFRDRKAHSMLTEVWNALEHVKDVGECLLVSRRLSEYISCDRRPDVVVIDEIGMLPFWLTYQICFYFQNRGVAIVCMGDQSQLKPVKSEMSLFHVDFDVFFPSKKIEMIESKRFTLEYERIINRLRELMDDEEAMFQYVRETFPVADCITQEMLKKARCVLAFKNDTVNNCNDFYLDCIMGHEKEYVFQETRLRRNCRAMVNQNHCGEGVCNGSSVIFLDYDSGREAAVCRKIDTGERVLVYRSTYNRKIPLVPGFSITIHKFQGETIDNDNIIMCFDKSTDMNLIYTALSRVRDMSQILAVIL